MTDILLPTPRRQSLASQTTAWVEPTTRHDPSLPTEGYRLRVTEGGVEVDSGSEAATFYANKTLAQLRRLHQGRLPLGTIEDWPDVACRGVMLDISRDKVPTMETLLALVDRLASWKINQLQLYTEHTYAYLDHEEVWRSASPLDANEIRQLDEYCRARFIELVPNQNCLGHWERWLRHDRYRTLAVAPDGWDQGGRHREPTTLDPTNPEARQLVRSLLSELLPNFSSRRLHVGLDEPWELPKERMADYLDWVHALRALPELDGLDMLMWGDILEARPDLLAKLPGGTTICEWWYDAGWPWAARGEAYATSGHPWWACPGTSSWQTILGRWDNAVADIAEAVDGALEHGGSGVLVTDWGDRGHLQFLPISEPGFAWTAAQSWCRSSNRDLDLAAALDAHCYYDEGAVMGGVLRDLGNAYLKIGPQFPNMSTLILHVYFPQMQVGAVFTEGMTIDQVTDAEGVLVDCNARLERAKSTRDDASLVLDELRSSIAFVELLCRDLRARLAVDGFLTSVPEPARLALAADLEPMRAHYRELWLARNRPGGLDDSAAWLDHLDRCYRTGTVEEFWGGW